MNKFWKEIFDKRNFRLMESDWTQCADSPLSAEKKAEWAAYRQSLRDILNNLRDHPNYVSDEESNPLTCIMDWSWPTKPS